jgi:hypothetical protein
MTTQDVDADSRRQHNHSPHYVLASIKYTNYKHKMYVVQYILFQNRYHMKKQKIQLKLKKKDKIFLLTNGIITTLQK